MGSAVLYCYTMIIQQCLKGESCQNIEHEKGRHAISVPMNSKFTHKHKNCLILCSMRSLGLKWRRYHLLKIMVVQTFRLEWVYLYNDYNAHVCQPPYQPLTESVKLNDTLTRPKLERQHRNSFIHWTEPLISAAEYLSESG